jgi:hypothetical protein
MAARALGYVGNCGKPKMNKGDKVRWTWGQGEATGTIEDIFERRVTRRIKGKSITRNGSPDQPAILIRQDDGDRVLKLQSEVERS